MWTSLECPEVVIIGRAAAKCEEAAEAQDPLDVLRPWVAFEDQGRVAAGPPEPMPERVDPQSGLEDPVDVDQVRHVGDPGLAEQSAAGIELLANNALEFAQVFLRDQAAQALDRGVVEPAAVGLGIVPVSTPSVFQSWSSRVQSQ